MLSTPASRTNRPIGDEATRESLVTAAAALARRRSDLISADDAARLVALGWLEWQYGTLRLTAAGRSICDEVLATRW